MRKLIILFLLALFVGTSPVHAFYDPLSVANNRFGIHIADTNDITDVAPLVNSTGGDWGYVTLVIPDSDRNTGKWKGIFNQMRKSHLIPLVRLATHVDGSAWARPNDDTIRDWIAFLTSLNWPMENRYVIVFNEPNHANEWGNTLDPEGYADVLVRLTHLLKAASDDFFILPAGLDMSASSDGRSLNGAEYLRRMVAAKPELLSLIDGWNSHSYPNPGFSGSPYAWGRGTVHTYDWELSYLSSLGLSKKLPVFITETGWQHSEGKFYNSSLLSPQTVAQYVQVAAQTAWADSRVAAVTPFIFNYQDYPFDHFSWKKIGAHEYYTPYYTYQSVPKQQGRPKQRQIYEFIEPQFPKTLVAGSTYTIKAILKNEGQAIVDPNDSYELSVSDTKNAFSGTGDSLPILEPTQKGEVTIHIKTPPTPGLHNVTIGLKHYEETIPLTTYAVQVIPPPTLTLTIPLAWRKTSDAEDVTILVYKGDELLYKVSKQSVLDGLVKTAGLTNVVPGETYRVVVLVPYYLPRQRITKILSGGNAIRMQRFLPLDFNHDGALNLSDVFTLLQLPPHIVFNLFFGQ